jgi:hypothetical protein
MATSAPDTNWISVASSADGTKLVAAVGGGQIYTSVDSGATWTAADAPSTNWQSVASSADGSKMVAVVSGGQIYTWQAASPSLDCPTNLTVDFTSENGVTVVFTTEVTNPYPGDPPVSCVPPSGSTFPMGNTTVVCSATNIFGKSSQCSFTVTVLGARAVKEDILAQMKALKPLRFGDSILKAAVANLNQALASGLWVDDEHLSRKGGVAVFLQEEKTVRALRLLMGNGRSGVSDTVLLGFINRLVNVDRLLAVTEINSIANVRTNRNLLNVARREVTMGDQAVANQRYELGIEHYRNAWVDTTRMVRGNF